MEEERQIHTGRDKDDEAIHRDLAEDERPVVGEDVLQDLVREPRHVQPVVDPAPCAPDDVVARFRRVLLRRRRARVTHVAAADRCDADVACGAGSRGSAASHDAKSSAPATTTAAPPNAHITTPAICWSVSALATLPVT